MQSTDRNNVKHTHFVALIDKTDEEEIESRSPLTPRLYTVSAIHSFASVGPLTMA